VNFTYANGLLHTSDAKSLKICCVLVNFHASQNEASVSFSAWLVYSPHLDTAYNALLKTTASYIILIQYTHQTCLAFSADLASYNF